MKHKRPRRTKNINFQKVTNTITGKTNPKGEDRIKKNFLGKIDGFKNKKEKSFEKAHLRAYLNGNKYFKYGYEDIEVAGHTFKQPAHHKVLCSYS